MSMDQKVQTGHSTCSCLTFLLAICLEDDRQDPAVALDHSILEYLPVCHCSYCAVSQYSLECRLQKAYQVGLTRQC